MVLWAEVVTSVYGFTGTAPGEHCFVCSKELQTKHAKLARLREGTEPRAVQSK